ncbi:MAG: tetratricopeptide repeat protein [Gammaproteobacteria bacterium]
MGLKTLRIFISSPGDVAQERLIARRVIGRLDSQLGDTLSLEAVYWENHPLLATASFQEQLPTPSQTDIVLCVLWTRLGTPLPGSMKRADGSGYASGTEFEFEDAIEAHRRGGKPEILVYRCTARPEWSADATLAAEQIAQKDALDRFVTRWFFNEADRTLRAAFHSFGSPAQFEELLEAHLSRLVRAHLPTGFQMHAAARAWRSGSPFRGLEPFESAHSAVFFGRTAAIASVLLRLRRQAVLGKSFVLVVSMSGAGKSSLLRAGVLPLLTQPEVVGTATRWRCAIVKPSEGQGDLFGALLNGLRQPAALPELEDSPRDAELLAQRVVATLAAADAGSSSTSRSETHLAFFVDQLEEIFSDERISAADRTRFISALGALARSGRVSVLAAVRNDVYPRLAELPELIELKEGDGQFDLLPPNLREIGQIIRAPATAAGLRFEARPGTGERLDDTIRDAAAKNPGALPLLEFLLEELYVRRSSEDVLTFRAYEELGGVEGALTRRAEQVVTGAGPEALAALPSVFRELMALGLEDDSRALRRTAKRTAFRTGPAQALVNAMLDARLLVASVDAEGEPTVSLAHEALLEFWPRLSEWRETNRENLRVRARLTAAAQLWEREKRSPDFLLARGKPIAEARGLVADGVPISPLETELLSASVKRATRFRRLRDAAVAGLAILAVAASIAAYVAQRQSKAASVQATTARRTSDFMVSLFSIADPEENRGETVTVREILDRGVDEMRSSLVEEPQVRANLLRAMGQAYGGLGLYPKAGAILSDSITAAEAARGPEDLLKANLALANVKFQQADYASAEKLYRQSLAQATSLDDGKSPALTEALNGLAASIYELGKVKEAEELYRRALALDEQRRGEQHADTARSLSGLGVMFLYEGRYKEGQPLLTRALAIRKTVYGPRHVKVGETLNNLGALTYQAGDPAAALRYFQEALPIYRAVFGDDHPETAPLLNNIGRIELLSGNLAAAETSLTEALAIYRARLGEHADLTFDLNSLAMIAIQKNDLPKAEALLREALAIGRARKHSLTGQILGNYAQLYVRTHRLPEAREALRESAELMTAEYGDALQGAEGWRQAVLDSIAAEERIASGEFDEAERLLVKSLPVLQKRFGVGGLYSSQTLERFVALYVNSGQHAKAADYRMQWVAATARR